MSADPNNRRIAKNTIFLYFRMLLTIGISLYTSRVVLEQLGENDYGIYGVVGGVVTMFSIISASLSSAIGRFITYELGKENSERLKVLFSTSMWILIGLGIIIVLLLETGGVWFLNCRMNINPSRLTAANWVLQCSTLNFLVNMLSVPYNAAIIAHERMNAFAYIGILEAILKLGVALMLFIHFFDSLIAYAILLVLTSLIIRLIYGLYCRRHFEECHFEFTFDKTTFKEMLGYSSWSFIGSSSAILKDQGVNVIINLFCGTAVNAARAISTQVNTAIYGFAQNFMLAVNPQIIKSYASGHPDYMFELGFRSSRLSYYLLLCLSAPIIVAMPYILSIWLTQIPPYTVSFTRLTLILGMLEAISIPLQYMIQASGKVKIYQLTVGGIQMLNFPLSYLLLLSHFSPDSVYVLSIVLSQICLGARLSILKRILELPVRRFLSEVYLKILAVTLVCVVTIALLFMIPVLSGTSLIAKGILTFILAVPVCLGIGFNQDERRFFFRKVLEIYNKIKSNYAGT